MNCTSSNASYRRNASVETNNLAGFDFDVPSGFESRFTCPICLQLMRQPIQTLCGHRFCYQCIITSIRKRPKCPIDNESLDESQIFQDRSTEREIMNLKVVCPHNKCDVVMELKYMLEHMEICLKKKVECKLGCGVKLSLAEENCHYEEDCARRKVNCDKCSQQYVWNKYKEHIEEECRATMNELVACKHCHNEMRKYKLKAHLDSDCSDSPIDCIFNKVGCLQKHSRKTIGQHMEKSTQIHLQYLMKFVVKLEKKNNNLQNQLDELKQKLPEPSVKKNLENNNKNFRLKVPVHPYEDSSSPEIISNDFSERFSNITKSISGKLPLSRKVSDVSMSSYREKRSKVHRTGSLSPLLTSSKSVENKKEDKIFDNKYIKMEHLVRELMIKMEFQNCQMKVLTKRISAINTEKLPKQNLTRTNSNGFNSIYRNNSLSTPKKSICNQCNKDGVFYWKIENYTRLKQEAVEGKTPVLNSPGFYTSSHGYKLCVRANLNGVDHHEGINLALFIHIVEGQFDFLLSWPMHGKISITLINQVEHKKREMTSVYDVTEVMEIPKGNQLEAFKRCVTSSSGEGRNHRGFGFVDFQNIGKVEKGGFLLDDSIIIKIKAEIPS